MRQDLQLRALRAIFETGRPVRVCAEGALYFAEDTEWRRPDEAARE